MKTKRLKYPKGPAKIPSGYIGKPGWRYHPTKGFIVDRLGHVQDELEAANKTDADAN